MSSDITPPAYNTDSSPGRKHRDLPKFLDYDFSNLEFRIGSFYAFIFSRCKDANVTVVARSNYETVKAHGLKLNSIVHGDHIVRFDRVLSSPAKAGRTFDYVVCAHKAIDEDNSAGSLACVIDPQKITVVLIQNGIGIEEPFRQAFPPMTIISCVTWTGAKQIELGVVQHLERWEGLQIGLYSGSACDESRDRQSLDIFAALLQQGGTRYEVVPDIQQLRWKKIVSNAAWNPITTLTQMKTHAWLQSSPDALPLTRKLMTEVVTIAQKAGVDLDPNTPGLILEEMINNASVGSSMFNDLVAGKPMEVEPILGKPLRKARELGVDAPILETLYTLVTAVNIRSKQAVK
ncbi:uncharacterized protein E0L32_009234 [Thyridium curvatum]|uniref:2-dehydropantoate 2-reductase n=1 Tax=Thyridium curvatum TaxID=1093900 RepID=A0A507AX43_9PEZI|nr:uncharacterized protein E0L32_009234 [Thyridium curvatum]TPX09491.1 hypothetical protein E0L32_009234 [Thyridium curvatum]